MAPLWVLPFFAGLTAAITNQAVAESTVITSDSDVLIPSIWTDLTTLRTTTIISTAITQNAPSGSSSVLPADPRVAASHVSSSSFLPASDASSPPSGSSSVLPADPRVAASDSSSLGSSSVRPADPGPATPSSTGVGSPTSSGTSAATNLVVMTDGSLSVTFSETFLPSYATLTAPTTITSNFVYTAGDNHESSTLLPIVIGPGGAVVLNLADALPIGPLTIPKISCPFFLKLIGLCPSNGGESHSSQEQSTSPTTASTAPSSTTTSSNSESSSSCTTTKPVPSCIQTCNSVIQTGGVTTTTCGTPTCTSIQACSATATTSTVFETPTPIAACYFGGPASPSPSSPDVGPTSCPLSKRTVLIPENFEHNNVNLFVGFELDNAAEKGTLLLLRGGDPLALPPGSAGLPSSKRFQFLDKSFRTGIQNQEGCTTVYIFSKQGMWEAHFWDIPAFEVADDYVGYTILSTIPAPQVNFDNGVLNFIENGDGPQNPGIRQDTSAGGLFAADILGVFIVTPKILSNSPEVVYKFPFQVQQIRDKLQGLLPGGSSVPITTVGYLNFKPRPEGRLGTVLIQYDPHQSPAGASQTTALARIYVEGIAYPDMTWEPLPNQVPNTGQAARRDLEERGSDCSISQQSPPPNTLLSLTIPATGSLRSPLSTLTVTATGSPPGLELPPDATSFPAVESALAGLTAMHATTSFGVHSTEFPLVSASGHAL